jgi:hypothetical protein
VWLGVPDLPQSIPGVEHPDAAVCGQFGRVFIPGYYEAYEARSGFYRSPDHPVIRRVFFHGSRRAGDVTCRA